MRKNWLLILLALAIATPACRGVNNADHDGRTYATHADAADKDDDDGEHEDDDEQEIALSAVPPHVLAAARAALPGATITEAEMETENGVIVYSFDALLDGREWEIEVAADGTVLEVEADDDDEDDDEDDD